MFFSVKCHIIIVILNDSHYLDYPHMYSYENEMGEFVQLIKCCVCVTCCSDAECFWHVVVWFIIQSITFVLFCQTAQCSTYLESGDTLKSVLMKGNTIDSPCGRLCLIR